MLQTLIVRDVLLIQHLELDFHENLSVLTGETGAGKSILLDALGLALGERGNSGLVRSGAKQASVTAIFTPDTKVAKVLEEHEIESSDELIIKRTLTQDGRSKAYINNELVSIGLLKEIGEKLVEIHGQFDQLLDPSTHRDALDRYGNLKGDVDKVISAHGSWKTSAQAFKDAHGEVERLKINYDFLKLSVEELGKLDPQEGEEDQLVEERAFLANKSKLTEALDKTLKTLTSEGGIESSNNAAFRILERIVPHGLGKVEPILEVLDRLGNEAQEAVHMLNSLQDEIGGDSNRLETIEDRLYELRGMARKYNCTVMELPELYEKNAQDLSKLDLSESHLKDLEDKMKQAEAQYLEYAETLSSKRMKLSEKLAKAVNQELKPLKLENAQFFVEISRKEGEYSPSGLDHIDFQIQTNPGSPKGALKKIASGGERSRFMLALKVVLAGQDNVPTLIFDEIDSGVGGAVASAIGERLQMLSQSSQILVVTHSPQVASFGNQHLRVQKQSVKESTETSVVELDEAEQREEIARMLSGQSVTDEARAAADKLIQLKKSA